MGTIASPKGANCIKSGAKVIFCVLFTIVRLERWGYDPPKTLSNEAVQTKRIKQRIKRKNHSSIANLLNMLKAPITVIAVSETWLTESLKDVYSIPGYNFFAKSRTGKTGGGVGLYVNNSFDCKIYSDLCRMTEYLECIFLECYQAGTQSFIV